MKKLKIAAAVAAMSMLFTACGGTADNADQLKTKAEASADSDMQAYDFPADKQYEILRGVKYGMTMEEVKAVEGEPA